MNDYELILNRLEQLGVALTEGVTKGVEVAYPVILRQVYVDLVDSLVFFLMLIFFSTITFFISKELRKEYKEKNCKSKKDKTESINKMINFRLELEDIKFGYTMLYGISFLTFSLSVLPLSKIIKVLLNPHYYAALRIIELLGK